MKNLCILSLFGSFLVLLFTGCQKDKEDSDFPSLKITAAPDVVYCGESTVLTYQSFNTDELTLQGVKAPLFGTIILTDLQRDTTFNFVVKKGVHEVSKAKTITVKDALPIIVITSNPDVLPIGGGTSVISWEAQNTDSVSYNGFWYAPTGSMEMGFITATIDISMVAKGKGGENTGVVTIKVMTIEDEMSEMLCSGVWTLVQLDFCDTTGVSYNTFWTYENALVCQQDNTKTFTMNPNNLFVDYGIQCEGQNYLPGNCGWYISDNQIPIMGVNLSIVFLSKDTFIYTYPSFRGNGIPILVQCAYAHLP